MNLLMQSSAQRDVQFLKSPADAQHRFSHRDRASQQRQSGGVAPFVLQQVIVRGLRAIMVRRDV